MVKYEVASATHDHAKVLATNMRQADVEEAWDAYHLSPLVALQMSMAASRDTKVGLADGEIVCMFGVGRLSELSCDGRPWLVGSDALPKHARAFLRRNKAYISSIKTEFYALENYVSVKNKVAIRWLKWLGFTVHSPEKYGVEGLMFRRFDMEGS